MPVFVVQTPDGRRVRVEAADEATAIRGAQEQATQRNRARTPVEAVTGFMANVNRGLGIGDEIAAGMGATIDSVGDVVNSVREGRPRLPNVPQNFERNMARQRRLEQLSGPNAAALGQGTGNAATMLVPASRIAGAIGEGGRLVNAARGAVLGGTTAGAYAAADAGTPQERLQRTSEAVRDPVALALGAAGGALAGRPTRRPRAGAVRPTVRTLNAEGVQLTPGQIAGGIARHAEDAATSVPILGDAIRKARRRGDATFTNAVLNRALRGLGMQADGAFPTVPEGLQGRAAVAHVGDRLSAAYDALVPENGIRMDPQLGADFGRIREITETLTPANLDRLRRITESRILSRVGEEGAVDGPTFQRIISELRTESRRFSGSQDADQRAIAEAIDTQIDALTNAAVRQNQGYGTGLRRLDQGYAYLVRAENASARAGADDAFSPAQFDSAVRAGDRRTRRRGYARGEAMGQDLAEAGRDVMSSTVNNSGTADRAMIGGAVVGGVAGLPAVVGSAGLAYLGSKAYGPEAIRLANVLLSQRIAAAERAQAAAQLRQLSTDPRFQELVGRIIARVPVAAGVTAGARQEETQPIQ